MSSCVALKCICEVVPRTLALAVLVLSAAAHAGPCKPGTASVAVVLDGPGWRAPWATAVPDELATEIEVAGLCQAAADATSDAQVVLRFKSAAVVDMEVSAGQGEKRRSVSRTLELEPMPSGQWAFAVGVSASELLREAREVIPVLRVEPTSLSERVWSTTLRGAALFTSGGVMLLGAEVGARRTFSHLVLELDGVGGWAPTRTTELGSVNTFAAGGALSIGAVVLSTNGFVVDVGAMADVRWLRSSGVANQLAAGSTQTAVSVVAAAVSTLAWSNGPFEASLRVGIGGVPRAVSLQAGGTSVAALQGLAGLASLGAGVHW